MASTSSKNFGFSSSSKKTAMYVGGIFLVLVILAHLNSTSVTTVKVDREKTPIKTSTHIIYGRPQPPVVTYVGGKQNPYKQQFYN